MLPLLVLLALGQPAGCPADAEAAIAGAATLARGFDLSGAAARLDGLAARGCVAAGVSAEYWRGLQAARDAYRTGGDATSLQAVEAAIARLASFAAAGHPEAEVARVVLLAATAAAQSERADMEVMLEHAAALEARLPGGPRGLRGVTAHEAAGDLWLQVHRFEAARDAYRSAEARDGVTPRTILGLARVALRLGDAASACASYRTLLDLVRREPPSPSSRDRAEMAEAEAMVAGSCASTSAPAAPAGGAR